MNPWIKRVWKENRYLVIAIFLLFCFRSALADWNTVPTGSMKPTIVEGDRVFVNKIAYDLRIPFTGISIKRLSNPERGDIVTFDSEAADLTLIKRVIGLPGDTIEMMNNRLIVNGKPATYSFIEHKNNDLVVEENINGCRHFIKLNGFPPNYSSFLPIVVPKGKYLVLGDNRNNSADSRVYGLVPRNEIRGRSKLVVMSLNYENHYFPRSSRFLKELL